MRPARVSPGHSGPARGTGPIDSQPVPIRGRLVYNRLEFFRTADGKRENPRSEWRIKELPELRILDDDLWAEVDARFQERTTSKAVSQHMPIKYPFTGLIKCAHCRANFFA